MARKVFEISGKTLVKYTGTAKVVNVPLGVKYIGPGAFRDNETAEKVILPEGVLKIRREAFFGCSNLRQIRLPDSLEWIGRNVFSGCDVLEDLTFPEHTAYPPDEYSNIDGEDNRSWEDEDDEEPEEELPVSPPKGIPVPNQAKGGKSRSRQGAQAGSLPAMEAGARELARFQREFQRRVAHDMMGEVTPGTLAPGFLDPVEFDIDWDFSREEDGGLILLRYYGLETDIVIPAGRGDEPVVSIGKGVFDPTFRIHVTSVVVPEGIQRLEKGAFNGCTALKKVTLPSTLKEVRKDAFRACRSLFFVNLPNGPQLI